MPKPLDMLLPIFALAFWTFLVLNVLGISRIRAGRRRLISADDFRLGESDRVPAQVRLTNRNYMNLLELPVLFYVICLIVTSPASARRQLSCWPGCSWHCESCTASSTSPTTM